MLLTQKGIAYTDINVDDSARLDEMRQRSGQSSVPQVFIGDQCIGGFDELDALSRSGELDKLLAGESVND